MASILEASAEFPTFCASYCRVPAVGAARCAQALGVLQMAGNTQSLRDRDSICQSLGFCAVGG